MSIATRRDGTKIVTGKFILSYPTFIEPQAGEDGGKPKYGAAFVALPGEDVKPFKEALLEAAIDKFGESVTVSGKKVPMAKALEIGTIKSHLRTDTEAKGYEGAPFFFNARTARKPGLVGRDGTRLTDEEIEEKLYPGARVRASITAYGYDNPKGGKGVTFSLHNVQFIEDGERLDSVTAPEEDFDRLDEEPVDVGAFM